MEAMCATIGYAPGAMNLINGAYDRMLKSDVKYWFVIDIGTLK